MSEGWQGGSTRAWRKLRAHVLMRDGHVCQLQLPGCTTTATHAHHLDGVEAGLMCSPLRIVAACEHCNLKLGDPNRFSLDGVAPDTRVPVLSLSPRAQNGPLTPRSELAWDPVALMRYEWLQALAEVPENAAPPLYMSLPAADAVGSYGAEAIEWIEKVERKTLRWWQKLAITRQLEHREDGTLCYRTLAESASRRSGKSMRMRGVALWRMAHADLFGEVQTIIHTGSDVAICREIQRGAWRWAEGAGWTVVKANGKEALEAPDDSRWLVRAQSAVYGWDVCYGLVDEAWDVKPDTVTEGLEPATLERMSPQLHLTSTAHRRATSLMKGVLRAALTMEDPETLVLVWGAPPGADVSSEAVWRAASPHWSEDRRRLLTGKYTKALAGEVDPAADDPDPMAGFTAQYLNMWDLDAPSTERGDPAVSAEDWADLAAVPPDRAPDAAALESWFGDGISVALAWRLESGQAVVRAVDVPDLAAAAEVIRQSGYRRRIVQAGESLLDDPALRGIKMRKASGRAAASVLELARLIQEDAILHDGGQLLTDQALGARTMPGADGPRMVSVGRFDAVKTAVWAATTARSRRVGRGRVVAV